MFRRRDDDLDNFDGRGWDEEFTEGGSPARRILPLLIGLIVLAAVAAVGYFLLQRGAMFDTPQRAAAQWLDVFIAGDTERLLDLTCNDQLEVANARAGVMTAQALIEVVPIVELLDLTEILPVVPDISQLLEGVEFDLSNLSYSAPENPVGQTMLTVVGQLRVKPFGDAWFGVPVDERWRMVEEGGAWKWCGREPQSP